MLTDRGLSDVALSPDGALLAATRSWRGEATVSLCDPRGRLVRLVARFDCDWDPASDKGPLLRLAFSPDSKRLATVLVPKRDAGVGGENGVPEPARAEVWDVADGRKRFALEKAGEQAAFSPDGRWIATLADPRPGQEATGGPVRFWRAADGQPAFTYAPTGDGGATVLAFAPDGRLVLAGRKIRVFEVADNGLEPVWTFDEPARCLAFSKDGRWLASSERAGDVDLWDLRAGRLDRRIREARRGVPPDDGYWKVLPFTPGWLAFSPDGRWLAYATDSQSVRLWNVEAGQDVLVLNDFPLDVARLLFVPDGRLLAVSDDVDPTWHAWDGSPLADDLTYGRLARQRVAQLFQEVGLADEVKARLEAAGDLPAAARRLALRLAEEWKANALDLEAACRKVVRAPGGDAAAYRLALRQAEAACRLAPNDAGCLNTLGAALYRTERFAEARDALLRARSLRQPDQGDQAEDLALLALACRRLGRTDEARAWLGRLRRLKDPRPPGPDADLAALRREAEALIEGSARP
jgi:hypothetical protein